MRLLAVGDRGVGSMPATSSLYEALTAHVDVVAVITPLRTWLDRAVQLAVHASIPLGSVLDRRERHVRTVLIERQLREFRGKFDVVFANESAAFVAPGLEYARRRYVLFTDTTYANNRRFWRSDERDDWWERLERDVCRHASVLYPWSRFAAASLIDDYGCDPSRVVVVGAGANLIRSSLAGRRWDSGVALFVGMAFERKGGSVLLDAWPEVRRHCPAAELWIAGPRWRLARAGDGVRWLGRVRDRLALAELFDRAQVFVMPSLYEPWGHVFLEAMGHGLPCIGADACAMPEIISAETGVLVPPANVSACAEALVTLLSDPPRCAALGAGGYEAVCRHHTWAQVVQRMLPSLREVVEAGES